MDLKIVGDILKRAVELDNKKRYTEALICYQEGLQSLFNIMKEKTGDERTYLRSKIDEYMNQAEKLKRIIEKLKQEGNFHEQFRMEDNSVGHSFESIFGRFLDEDLDYVEIEDPYIRMHHQCQNLLRFCELLVKKCKKLQAIKLLTVKHNAEQEKWLNDISSNLRQYNVSLNITYSTTLHDRQITLSTGWIIKIGRGLDYFKAPSSKFSIGTFDLDLRPCHDTTVDIFHSNNLKKINC